VMEENLTNTLIHGHTHRPAKHQLSIHNQPAQRIVLGDWNTQGWYLTIDKNNQRLLISFDI